MSKIGLWSFDASFQGLEPDYPADPEYVVTVYDEGRNPLVVFRQAGRAGPGR